VYSGDLPTPLVHTNGTFSAQNLSVHNNTFPVHMTLEGKGILILGGSKGVGTQRATCVCTHNNSVHAGGRRHRIRIGTGG